MPPLEEPLGLEVSRLSFEEAGGTNVDTNEQADETQVPQSPTVEETVSQSEVEVFIEELGNALCMSRRMRREQAHMGGFLYGIASLIRSYVPALRKCENYEFASTASGSSSRVGIRDGMNTVRLMALAPHPKDPNVLFVADQTRVWELKLNGEKRVVAGGTEKDMKDGPALEARFRCIGDMVIDRGCSIYLTDYPNNRIRILELDSTTPMVKTVAGSGYTTEPKEGTGNQALFAFPAGITMDRARRYLYCTDSSYVRRIKLPPPGMPVTPENVVVENIVKNNGESLYGLEFDRTNDVLLATSVSGIYRVDPRENLPPGALRIQKIVQNMPYTSTPVCDPWSDMILLNGYDTEVLHFLQYNQMEKKWQREKTEITTEFPLLTWHPKSDVVWASATKTELIAVEVW